MNFTLNSNGNQVKLVYLLFISSVSYVTQKYFNSLIDAKGINPDTIRIGNEGKKVRVEFEPPNSQFYSQIVFRICLPSSTSGNSLGGSGRSVRPSGELVFLRPIKDSSSSSLASIGAASTDRAEECGDYEITFAELGFLQLELDRPLAEYTFQFLVYQDGQLRQITRQVRWNGGKYAYIL